MLLHRVQQNSVNIGYRLHQSRTKKHLRHSRSVFARNSIGRRSEKRSRRFTAAGDNYAVLALISCGRGSFMYHVLRVGNVAQRDNKAINRQLPAARARKRAASTILAR